MAKYLDQAGAQHLAEALMGATKTISGQTIWGSGNIEAGGGGIKTYHITGDQEWLNNAEALASPEFKVVILDKTTGIIGSTANTNYVLCNAIVTNNTPANMDYISIGSDATAKFYFINCSFVNNGVADPTTNVPYGCELGFQNSYFYFKNCNLKLTEPSASDHIFMNCEHIYMTNCELRCLKGGYLVQTRLSCMDSIICGLKLASDGAIFLMTGNSMSTISHCTFETTSSIDYVMSDSANNTIIEWCDMRDAMFRRTLYNVKYCTINETYVNRFHPYILDTQTVDNTAAGGFNTIIPS